MCAVSKESERPAMASEAAQTTKSVGPAGASLALFVVFSSGSFGLAVTDPLVTFS